MVAEDEKFFRKNLQMFGENAATIASTITDHATQLTVTIPDTMALNMD
jgi:hypothetical protein